MFDCLSKFTFGQGFTQLVNESYFYLYHTCVKKSIEYIKNSLKWDYSKMISGDIWQAAIKKNVDRTHHISRVVSLLSLCGPEDFALLAPAQWILRLAGREVSWPLHQWQSRVISDLLSGYSRGSISSPRQTRLLDEENSPVPSYWSFYSRSFTFLVFSRPQCDIRAFFMHKTRFYLFKVLRRNKTSSRVLAACQWTFSDEE